MSRNLPDGLASNAEPRDAGKLFAPAAARNVDVICDLLADVAPESGQALELASGTGQHVVAFARRMPGLTWQPTETDAARRASIHAYAAESGLSNIAPSRALDAVQAGWAAEWPGQDLIFLSNLLHLISSAEAETLIHEAARAVRPGGKLVIYGPFMRGGELTSDGDRSFDARLRAGDPEIGYKDDFDMLDHMVEAGLDIVSVVEMPANNLALVAGRPDF
ncbi:MAG: DUF938 domain-containing protein [Marinibacterium sp.]